MALENNQIGSSNIDNDEISLKELIIKAKEWVAFIKSKWKIIILAGLIGGLTGVTITFFEKPTYKALLTFAMEEDKGGGGGGGGGGGLGSLASSFGIDLGGVGGGGAFAASNLFELMKSRLIVEKVLLKPVKIEGKTTSLAEYYIEINELRKSWQNNNELNKLHFLSGSDRSNFTFKQDSILMRIYKSLISEEKLNILQKDKKITILTIEVISNNEIFSKIFCENLAKETSDFYIQTKSKKARLNFEVLQNQVDSVRNTLNNAITYIGSEIDNNFNLNPALSNKTASAKKSQIDIQSNTAIFTNLLVQLELSKITLRKETPLIQIIDSPIYPLDKNKHGKINSFITGAFILLFLTIIYLLLAQLAKKLNNN